MIGVITKLDLSKIIDMSLCCFNEEISMQFLSLDCSEFEVNGEYKEAVNSSASFSFFIYYFLIKVFCLIIRVHSFLICLYFI